MAVNGASGGPWLLNSQLACINGIHSCGQTNPVLIGSPYFNDTICDFIENTLHWTLDMSFGDDACRAANENNMMLADALSADPRVSSRIDRATIERLTSPKNYLGLAPEMVDRVLASAKR